MASNIKLKRSAVQGKKPHTDDLELGELALNTFDGKLFAEVNTGIATVVEIGSNLTNQTVSGVSTVGILTVTSNANIDGSLFVGGIQVSGGGAVIGDDITTRNLNATGITTLNSLEVSGSVAFNQNVGVNTTTLPTEALFVNGDLRVSGVATISGLTFPSQDGAANQVIKTDGNGRLSFGAAASANISHVLPVGTRTQLANNVIQVVHVPITSGINTVDGRSGAISVTESASVDVRSSTDPNGKTLTQTFFNTFA